MHIYYPECAEKKKARGEKKDILFSESRVDVIHLLFATKV